MISLLKTITFMVLMPDVIEDPNAYIHIRFGTTDKSYTVSDLRNGVEYVDRTFSIQNKDAQTEYPFKIKFLLKNRKIYINAGFKDIAHKEYIGQIEYFKWSLFAPNLIDWHETKLSLEVQDKSGYLVFNMKYVGSSTIQIKGYWIGAETIYVITEEGLHTFPFEDYVQAIHIIETLKPDEPFVLKPE